MSGSRPATVAAILTGLCVGPLAYALANRIPAAPPPVEGAVFTIASASIAGEYHRRAVGMCELFNDASGNGAAEGAGGIDDHCAAVPTDGSAMNLECLRAGKVDFAIAQADICIGSPEHSSTDETEEDSRLRCARPGDETLVKFVVMGTVHGEALHIIARRGVYGSLGELAVSLGPDPDSAVDRRDGFSGAEEEPVAVVDAAPGRPPETVAISVGKTGSGTHNAATYALDRAGFDLDAWPGQGLIAFTPESPADTIAALCSKKLDLGFYMIQAGSYGALEAAPCDLEVLPIYPGFRPDPPYREARVSFAGGAAVDTIGVNALLLTTQVESETARAMRIASLLPPPMDAEAPIAEYCSYDGQH